MQKRFVELREQLLRAGVAPRHVRRYLDELTDHVADLREEEVGAGKAGIDAENAALERLGNAEQLAEAMLARPELRAWSARAPWAVFSVGPVVLLSGLYLIACTLLWTGWQMFLPGRSTPFVPIDGVAGIYFGVGRMLYFGGPVLVGWGIGLLAARQRLGLSWPGAGVALVALIGGMARVWAIGPATAGMPGHVHLGLTLGSTAEETVGRLVSVGAIYCLAALPYVIWKLKRRLPRAEAPS